MDLEKVEAVVALQSSHSDSYSDSYSDSDSDSDSKSNSNSNSYSAAVEMSTVKNSLNGNNGYVTLH